MMARTQDPAPARKARGAFFTPPAIAEFLTRWAIRTPDARVLDPTCGEAVFLEAAAGHLRQLGAVPKAIAAQLTGVDGTGVVVGGQLGPRVILLNPSGRLAMVLPAELLTVHYAEPVRRWLKGRFAAATTRRPRAR